MTTIKDLENQLTVLAAIQERQSRIQKLQAEELDAIRARNDEFQRSLDIERSTREDRMREWDTRIEKLVSGFGAFLTEAKERRSR